MTCCKSLGYWRVSSCVRDARASRARTRTHARTACAHPHELTPCSHGAGGGGGQEDRRGPCARIPLPPAAPPLTDPRWLLHVIRSALSAAWRRLHYVCCTLSFPRSHGVCCILAYDVCCTLSPALLSATRCAQPRTSARTPQRLRARTHTRAHTRACESMRLAMVGTGAGAGGSQEGG